MLITRGAGNNNATGRRIEVGDVEGLATALERAPAEVEGWWSPHVWKHNHRLTEDWESAAYVALDLDTAGHTPLAEAHGVALEEAARGAQFSGSIFHRTPAGARVVFAFDEPCTDPVVFERAARGAAWSLMSDLTELDLHKGISVDAKVHLDRARLYYTPNAIAKGKARKANVVVIRRQAYRASDLEAMDTGGIARQYVETFERRGGPAKRAAEYVAKMGPSVEGNHGDDHAFRVAAVLVNDFQLAADDAWSILCEWNTRCEPPWHERDLRRFLASASRNSKRPPGSKLEELRHDKGPWPKAVPPETKPVEAPLAKEENPDFFDAHFKFFSAQDLREPPPRQEYLWHPYVPKGLVTVLAGPGGVSKTTLLTHLAVSRALGVPMFGAPCRPGKTVILTTEDGELDYRRKIFALGKHIPEFDAETVASSVPIIDCSGIPVRLVESDKGGWYPTAIPDLLAASINRRAPGTDLIIMETVSRLAGGVENNESLSILVESAQRLCRLASAAVILVAHVSQEAARQGYADAYAARGGSALGDNGRSTMILTGINENNRKQFAADLEIGPEKMKRIAVLSHAKSNGAKPADPLLLERITTPFGAPILEVFNARPADPLEPVRRLVGVVATLSARGTQVSRRKLREHLDELALAKHRIDQTVNTAISQGWITETQKTTRGGGLMLVPTGLHEVAHEVAHDTSDAGPLNIF